MGDEARSKVRATAAREGLGASPPPAPLAPAAPRGGKKIPIQVERRPEREVGGQGIYIISVAARLVQMHPQTLRKYERLGLVSPSRSQGHLRLYSDQDLARLRLIKYLVEERGMNLAGVELALSLADRLLSLHRHLASLPEGGLEEVEREVRGILRSLRLVDESEEM